jgi:hypothetical protein
MFCSRYEIVGEVAARYVYTVDVDGQEDAQSNIMKGRPLPRSKFGPEVDMVISDSAAHHVLKSPNGVFGLGFGNE